MDLNIQESYELITQPLLSVYPPEDVVDMLKSDELGLTLEDIGIKILPEAHENEAFNDTLIKYLKDFNDVDTASKVVDSSYDSTADILTDMLSTTDAIFADNIILSVDPTSESSVLYALCFSVLS